MESTVTSEVLNKFYNDYFKKYQDIINVINDNKDISGISVISQKEIAEKLNISQTLVSKCLIRLEKSDKCIEKIKSGVYRVNHIDMKKYGVYPKAIKYIYSALRFDFFLEFSWEEKAELLRMSVDEVIMINGYWIEFVKLCSI